MSPAQDKGYWRRWSAVVRAHGLNRLPKTEQDEERHQITLEATKGRTSSHKDVTDNKEITRLFRILEYRAQPDNLNAAIPVANPENEAEADEQRRCVVALSKKGLPTDEIARIAAPLCRRHRVGDWTLLPSKVLHEMMHWKQFQPAEIARRRHLSALPLQQTGNDAFTYYLRPPPPTPKPVHARIHTY
jgi:hypothetical protein